MSEIDKLLEDRGSRYGDFGVQARTAQAIRAAFQTGENWDTLPPYMREGLDLISTKLSRMLCGDFMYLDNVVDIIGYMTLVKTEMEKEHAHIKECVDRVKEADKIRKEQNPYWADSHHDLNDALRNSPLHWTSSVRNP